MTKQKAEVRFVEDKCLVIKDGKTIEIGKSVNGGLYKLYSPVVSSAESAYFATTNAPLSTWHYRYGHLNNSLSRVYGLVFRLCAYSWYSICF